MSSQDHRRESKSDEPKTYILVDFGSQFYDSGLASLDRDCSGFGKLSMIGKLNREKQSKKKTFSWRIMKLIAHMTSTIITYVLNPTLEWNFTSQSHPLPHKQDDTQRQS